MNFWTESNTTILKELVAGGHSASQIVRIMSAPSRNAVIGKCHRLGLKLLGNATEGDRRARVAITRKAPWDPPISPVEPVDEPDELETPFVPGTGRGAPFAITGLHARQCKFPAGDADSPDFHFCENQRVHGSSYCAAHRAKCTSNYAAPKRTRIRKRISRFQIEGRV